MGSHHEPISPFTVLADAKPDDSSLPAFMVSTTRGFLPRADPIVTLPSEFDPLESILQCMPVKTSFCEPGLLASGKLGETVDAELPDLTPHIDKYAHDLPLMNALYRDYSFLASAYLLEPCHMRFVKGEEYGLGRDVLPANIARPIYRCAKLTNFKPFMEYAGSYALYNYRLADPALGLDYSNLRLIRAFEHGLDPSSSEAGFVLVHIAMVSHSPLLISGVMDCLSPFTSPSSPPFSLLPPSSAPSPSTSSTQSRQTFNRGLSKMLSSLRLINAEMEKMWTRSRPRSYTSFRTFIFGITSQSMFPSGVLYQGIPEFADQPQQFRGESGANDSMIPLTDNFLSIPMPDTPLTEILKDFREYRPSNHRGFIEWVKLVSDSLGLKHWALHGEGGKERQETRRLWIKLLDQVREFRWRHWCFAKEYILKQTSHPTATGGSPIVTWLPNQLGAVLREMERVYGSFGEGERKDLGGEEVEGIMDLVGRQKDMLDKEVRRYCEERGVVPSDEKREREVKRETAEVGV
ncbi:hypothetical protein QBC35DRAFT_62917 [Podospora australis]|uniref:Indoleamine 2,3-dioxygenase n=1 Tax=Podospora australis TaxID=1536484 RepID=A0AAN6WYE6_9PEZI|nr:hypothetical protein QBC35DRAFT_62917 [Podospora australis]